MYRIRKIFYPEIFQGRNRYKNYFEGWYYKITDKSMKNVIAVIPGISIGRNRQDAHAFIQVLTNKNQVSCIRYPLSDFRFCEKEFAVWIAGNYFARDRIDLELSARSFSISGKLEFSNIAELPKKISMPGIMGPYSYVPFMECRHGIINIQHCISGSLNIMGKEVDFTGGCGYIEKDWGRSFPKNWIWLQCNHFETEDVTLMFSKAHIPWFGRSFQGFISFLRIRGRLYLFATYTGAKIRKLQYSGNDIRIILQDRKYRLFIHAVKAEGASLKAPHYGRMVRKINESISSFAEVCLTDHKGNVIYKGRGSNTGMEITE